MKKSLFVLGALSAFAFMFTGCPDQVDPSSEKEIVLEDGTINISALVDDVVLKYNDWGTTFYSYLQSDKFDITELFTDGLPKAGDSVKYYWKGKSNRDIKKLHMLVVDIKYNYDENGEYKDEGWTHLLTEKQITKPIATNIKAGEEFEIKGSVTLDKGNNAENTINILLCCSTDDADGPIHLYSTAKENTEKYDEYMTNTGKAIMTSGIKVEKKGKIEFSKETKTISFKELPKIKIEDGTIADCSTDEGKATLLDNGYFYLHFWGDDLYDFWKTISNSEKNTCGHGGWGGTDSTFKEYTINFKEEITGEPIYGECAYFALASENVAGTTGEGGEENPHYYYFPVVAFDVEIK